MTIYGVGHSTHTPDEFLSIVQGIDVIVDVRSHPTSKWGWWRKENAELWLPENGIQYRWIKDLGGWDVEHFDWYSAPMQERGVDLAAYSGGAFPKQRIGVDRDTQPDPHNPSWTNQGLYDYSWYMTTDEFRAGLDRLAADYGRDDQPKAAIMCCEALWWKCHRSMVADALIYRHGIDLQHIKPSRPKRVTTSRVDSHSRHLGNRLERYSAGIWEALPAVGAPGSA